ncbi:hypothetical protein GGG16DRAFT_119569 [Schizophyllum commune]
MLSATQDLKIYPPPFPPHTGSQGQLDSESNVAAISLTLGTFCAPYTTTDDAHAANPTSRSLLAERDTLIQHGDMCDYPRRCAISSGTLLRSSTLTPTAVHCPHCSCQPRAAESERGHPLTKVAEEVGYLRRRAGLKGGAACSQIHYLRVICRSKPPEACAGALGEGCEWGGVPLSPRYELFSQTMKAPDASAGSLGRDLGRGRTPLPLARGTESGTAPSCAHNPPPEACARTLGEGCERGGVPLTPYGALVRAQESGGTAPLVEGSFLLILRRGRAKEKVSAYE